VVMQTLEDGEDFMWSVICVLSNYL
jgi:hypothetical protein